MWGNGERHLNQTPQNTPANREPAGEQLTQTIQWCQRTCALLQSKKQSQFWDRRHHSCLCDPTNPCTSTRFYWNLIPDFMNHFLLLFFPFLVVCPVSFVPGQTSVHTPSTASHTCAQCGAGLCRQAHQHSKCMQVCICCICVHLEAKENEKPKRGGMGESEM